MENNSVTMNHSLPKHHKVYPNFSLQDKVYIVTGAGRGMGLAIAESMTEAGAEGKLCSRETNGSSIYADNFMLTAVHCFDRLLEPHPEFVATQELARRAHVGSLRYHHVDVRQTQHLWDTVSKIASQNNRLDGLVAAAGVQRTKNAVDYTPEEVTEMMDINYTGVFMTARVVAKQMIERECPGSIVLVASMSGMIANKDLICPVYNCSKAAVVQLARSLAMEWGRHGIRVNSLCPGYVVTAMVEKNLTEEEDLKEKWENENMLGRLASPDEFTGAAIFMLSNASSFMTGSALVIDGGHTAW